MIESQNPARRKERGRAQAFSQRLAETLFCAILLLTPLAVPTAVLAKPAEKAREVKIFAHRGGRKWAPENTLAAFKKSLDLGVYGIELDIHKCKSGELVVMHDEAVDRTTDGTGYIKDMTLAELKKLSCGCKFGKEFASERIPLLSEVLALVDGKMTINIEIKNTPIRYQGIEADLAKLLSSYKHKEKIVVSSFDHGSVKRFHDIAPSYRTALLTGDLMYDLGSYAKKVGADDWNPGIGDFREDSVKAAHAANLGVNVWTVNKPADWAQMVSWGVDSIITDDPQGLKEYLSKTEKSHSK